MLSEESYQLAWLVYVVAAAGILLCFQLWWLGRLAGPARLCLLLVMAVLMLLPQRAGEEVQTWAPAIVVAGFELLTHGPDAALERSRILGFAALTALLPGLVWALLRRRRRVPEAPQSPEGA